MYNKSTGYVSKYNYCRTGRHTQFSARTSANIIIQAYRNVCLFFSSKGGDIMDYPVAKTGITLAEMPNYISFYIQLANCNIKCEGCHSKYLWKKIARTDIECIIESVKKAKEQGADMCIIFGDINNDITENDFVFLLKEIHKYLPICVYSGAPNSLRALGSMTNTDLIDYIKLGSYIDRCGGLNKRTTNQRMYKVDSGELVDITGKLFWKEEGDSLCSHD